MSRHMFSWSSFAVLSAAAFVAIPTTSFCILSVIQKPFCFAWAPMLIHDGSRQSWKYVDIGVVNNLVVRVTVLLR